MRMEWSDQLIEDFLSVEGLEMTEMGRSVVMNCMGGEGLWENKVFGGC